MTPTEQDKELRRLISDLMADLMVDVSLKKLSKHDGDIIEKGRLYLESHNDRLDIIMRLIIADRERVALEKEEMAFRYAIQTLQDTSKEFALENLQRQLDKNLAQQEEV